MKKLRIFTLILSICAAGAMLISCKDSKEATAVEHVDVLMDDSPVDSADMARSVNLIAAEEAKIEFLPETGDDFNPSQNIVGIMMEKTSAVLAKSMQHGFLRTAENLGYPALLLEADEVNTPAALLDKALSQGLKGLIIVADTPSIAAIIPQAREAGVKVVETYLPTDQTVDAILAPDPLDFAAEAASQMCEEAMRRGHVSGKILIVGAEGAETIGDAFITALNTSYPQFKPVTSLGGASPEEFVKNTPELAGILALKAGSPQDWNKICSDVSAKLKPKNTPKPKATPKPKEGDPTPAPTSKLDPNKRNPVIVGLDYTQKNIDSVKNAEIYALIARPYFDAAAQSMATLDMLLREIPTQTQVRLNAPVIRKKDVEKYNVIIGETKEWFTPTKKSTPTPASPAPSTPPADDAVATKEETKADEAN